MDPNYILMLTDTILKNIYLGQLDDFPLAINNYNITSTHHLNGLYAFMMFMFAVEVVLTTENLILA